VIREESVGGFLESLSSSSPTPGGGSVAAVAGATGASLTAMVARLTVGREGFEPVEARMREIEALADAEREAFLRLADRDAAAFDSVMAAFKMPKSTEEEKSTRSAAIQTAFVGAAEVPLEVARRSVALLRVAHEVIEEGNPDAASDGLSAAASLFAATLCALANVEINAGSIKDGSMADALRSESRALDEEAYRTMKGAEEAFHIRVARL
jgi:formiminotetrahydrofolate cyclodeaminase